ncbi:HugZ family pyridoxamine 5'-phosphate oxidase [Thalassotalea ganghwensis]
MREQAVNQARLFTRQINNGVLSTVSKNLPGYPFGSVTPFISDSQGHIYFYVSDIAQHSRNMSENSKVSLTLYQQAAQGDQNENARVTLVGDCVKVSGEQQDSLITKYVNQFPSAASYRQAHDFAIWRLDIIRVRYIAGFGKIFWLEADEWQQNAAPWDDAQEQRVIEHMNEDHVDAMTLILAHQFGIDCQTPKMSAVLTDGCYLQTNNTRFFIPFSQPCLSIGDIRKELVALTHNARAA